MSKKEPMKRWKKMLIGIIIVFFVVMIIGFLAGDKEPYVPSEESVPPAQELLYPETCQTKECFVEKAAKCETVLLESDEPAGKIAYLAYKKGEKSEYCTFTKEIISLHEGETQEMKDFLEGQWLKCYYEEGYFSDLWVYSLVDDLQYCEEGYNLDDPEAFLKERLGELMIFAATG